MIERCIDLWTNPGDIVLDLFDGIGSTGYQALLMGRKYVGVELKESYYQQSVENLKVAEAEYLKNNTSDSLLSSPSVDTSDAVNSLKNRSLELLKNL